MKDYAGVWAAELAHCHRFVYDDEDGRPQTCPEPVVAEGFRQEGNGRAYRVGACERHTGQLAERRPVRLVRSS